MRHIHIVATLAAITALTAACSTNADTVTTPTAQPGTPAASAKAPSSNTRAPRVADPIDASRFLQHPCGVLSEQKIRTFGNDGAAKPSNGTGSGPSCSWQNSSDGSVLGVLFITVNEHGLTNFYQARAAYPPSYFGYFEPTTVNGYPAIYEALSDDRKDGSCNLAVGITDTLAFSTGLEGGSNGEQSCVLVKKVASEVLKTLKGKG